MIVHNPAAQVYTQLVRINISSKYYYAIVKIIFMDKGKDFSMWLTMYLDQKHNLMTVVDYDIYFPYKLMPSQVGQIKRTKDKINVMSEAKKEATAYLELDGQGQSPLKLTFNAHRSSTLERFE